MTFVLPITINEIISEGCVGEDVILRYYPCILPKIVEETYKRP
jgi:hypothetical protein